MITSLSRESPSIQSEYNTIYVFNMVYLKVGLKNDCPK